MITQKKRQHIVPKFLQKNWSDDKTTVRVYLKKQEKFVQTAIKSNMQKPFFYGNSGKVEDWLSEEIESPVISIIAKMIKNPKKFQRKNKVLPPEMIDFLSVLYSRSESSMKPAKEWLHSFMDYTENHLDLTKKQILVKQEYQEKMIDTNEFQGQLAMIEPSERNRQEIHNGRYLLIHSSTTIFLPDEAVLGFCPLSPNLLMIYGDMVDINWKNRSKNFIVDLFNAFSLQKSSTGVIVGKVTSTHYIEKLKRNGFAQSAFKNR